MRLDRTEATIIGIYLVTALVVLATGKAVDAYDALAAVVAFFLIFFAVPAMLSVVSAWSICRMKEVTWLLAPYFALLGNMAIVGLINIARRIENTTGMIVAIALLGYALALVALPLWSSLRYARHHAWRLWIPFAVTSMITMVAFLFTR